MYKALKKIVGNYDNVKNYDYIICTFVGSCGPHEQCSISSDVLSPRCCGSHNSDNAPRRLLKVDFCL